MPDFMLDKGAQEVNTSINEQYDGDQVVNIGWDDEKFPATRLKVGANDKPDFDTTELGLLFPQNDPTEVVYIIAQFSHRMKAGSNIKPHIHWIQTSSDAPVFKIDYRWYENGSTPPSNWTTISCETPVFPYTSGSMLQICAFPEIDGSNINGVSSIMDIKLYRDDNVVSGDVLLKEFDIHFQIDQERGSRNEYVK